MWDLERIEDTYAMSPGITAEKFTGLRLDPNGPRLDVRMDLVHRIKNELMVVCGPDSQSKNGVGISIDIARHESFGTLEHRK